jgi:hypothetical protein
MSKEEKKIPVYGLWVLRRDGQHIEVVESSNYDEVFERYNQVKIEWAQAIKDKTPFELTKPIVTSFDPGLIYEITIKLITETTTSRYENPYQQNMVKNGFSSMFKSPQQTIQGGSDLLDGGYT